MIALGSTVEVVVGRSNKETAVLLSHPSADTALIKWTVRGDTAEVPLSSVSALNLSANRPSRCHAQLPTPAPVEREPAPAKAKAPAAKAKAEVKAKVSTKTTSPPMPAKEQPVVYSASEIAEAKALYVQVFGMSPRGPKASDVK
ncbi:hypothetical protein TeGR_g2677, partial [Tetraparma gracilis]